MAFYFQDDFWETVAELPDDMRKEAIASLVEYYFTGEEPQITGIASMPYKAFKGRIDLARKQSGNAKRPRKSKAEESKTEPEDSQTLANEEPNASQTLAKKKPEDSQTLQSADQSKSESKKDTSKEVSKRKVRFSPPSPAEVEAYSRQRGHPINGDAFCDYYDSNGWRVGRNPMKDWQAAVRTWIQREKAQSQAGGDDDADLERYIAALSAS